MCVQQVSDALVYVRTIIYNVCGQKKLAIWDLTALKSPTGVTYSFFVEFNRQKKNLIRQAIRSGMNSKAFY